MGGPQKYNEDEEVIKNNLKKFSKAQQVNSDEALLHKSDTSSLSKHNKQYTTLLKAYVKYFEINSKNWNYKYCRNFAGNNSSTSFSDRNFYGSPANDHRVLI